jgi:sulfate adenylyltransferase subunit 1 (EFTu-like GTPase family)
LSARGLLRFTTAGSVDDGKSTLIGRLLVDSKQVLEDQLAQVAEASRRRSSDGALDLSLITDGLRAEREQGITIDVAYRYFSTDRRRFIIADVPGHKQYTRNMVTGASTAELSIVLVDARKGVLEQSKRHAYISALLGIPHLVICVNKMDLADYREDIFRDIVAEMREFLSGLPVSDVTAIPISALNGDNVVERSSRMPWYAGPALLEHLETVEIVAEHPDDVGMRFPVQWVIRPGAAIAWDGASAGDAGDPRVVEADYRGYAGQIASGVLHRGDEVVVLPGGQTTRIAAIDTYDGELDQAPAPLSITLRLADELDVSRGDLICSPVDAPVVARELDATICWMSERPLRPGDRLSIKHTTRSAQAIVVALTERVNVDTLEAETDVDALMLNDIGRVRLRTSAPLMCDPYRVNRATGGFVLIDEADNGTVAAGIIDGAR